MRTWRFIWGLRRGGIHRRAICRNLEKKRASQKWLYCIFWVFHSFEGPTYRRVIEWIERIRFVTVRSFQLSPDAVKELADIRSGLFVVVFFFRVLCPKHISNVVDVVVLHDPGWSLYHTPHTVQELEVIRTVLFVWQGLLTKHISSVEGTTRLWWTRTRTGSRRHSGGRSVELVLFLLLFLIHAKKLNCFCLASLNERTSYVLCVVCSWFVLYPQYWYWPLIPKIKLFWHLLGWLRIPHHLRHHRSNLLPP